MMIFFKIKKIANKAISITIVSLLLLCGNCSADIKSLRINQQSATKVECEITPLAKSKAMIELILTDLNSTYLEGGGGITEIKQSHTNVYVVSISQEERIDKLTYEMAVDKSCKIKILKKGLS